MNKQIKSLVEASKKVLKDCALPNGALVAANSTKKYFPKGAKNYKYVWPRDGAYNCMAANILGVKVQEKFFKWLIKAEGWKKTGLFYEKYYVNGKKALHHLQPDQTGSVLMAVHDYYKDKKMPPEIMKLVSHSAEGLCKIWQKDHFTVVTQDLWEERLCFPDYKENFTYSLASCSKGLMLANEMIPNKKWLKKACEMKETALKAKSYFFRANGSVPDKRVDASLIGLTWPFEIVDAKEKRMVATIKNIEGKLGGMKGIHRYENDEYDGWMYKRYEHRKKGAGYWPLLTFWMSIYYVEKGNKKKALAYYNKVLKDLKSDHIPEQIFNNKIQISVSPLAWSHSMFVIASKKLGYLK